MKITQFPHMPSFIKINIMKSKIGRGLFAELPEYDVFTEADSEESLVMMINDLIYEVFEVPKEHQYKIKYVKEHGKDQKIIGIKKLIVMSTPDIIRKSIHA